MTAAHTTFVNNRSPWTGLKMTTEKYRPRVDPTGLTIERNVPLPVARTVRNKYEHLFGQMKPGECIKCKPEEVTPVANAMRKWIDDHKKRGELMVVSQRHISDGKGNYIGRVWLAEAKGEHGDQRKADGRLANGRKTKPRGVVA